MATSGSKNYTDTFTRNNIIQTALRRLGVYDSAEAVPGSETSDASDVLNLMIKEWSKLGIDMWVRKEATLFIEPGKQSYSLGPSYSYVNGQPRVGDTVVPGELTGATTLISKNNYSNGLRVADISGAGSPFASQFGTIAVLYLDDGTVWSSTVINVTATTVITQLTAPYTADVGNKVYFYKASSNTIDRPQQLLYVSRRSDQNLDSEVQIIGEDEYRLISDKGASGPPVSVYYRPTLSNGTLFVWPCGTTSDYYRLVLTYTTTVDDFDDGDDTAEFPPEWVNVLAWNLAAELAAEYGLAESEQARLWTIANDKLQRAMDYDIEQASVVFSRDYVRT